MKGYWLAPLPPPQKKEKKKTLVQVPRLTMIFTLKTARFLSTTNLRSWFSKILPKIKPLATAGFVTAEPH